MEELVNWCNANTGFLSAILSVVGVVISLVAIVVSIRTARLPYRKAVKLSATTNIMFSKNMITSDVSSEIAGMSVNAVNVGFRNICITYLGISVKAKGMDMQKFTKINEPMDGLGVLAPSSISTNSFAAPDLVYWLSKLGADARVYACATDTEGKTYLKRIGKAAAIAKGLSR